MSDLGDGAQFLVILCGDHVDQFYLRQEGEIAGVAYWFWKTPSPEVEGPAGKYYVHIMSYGEGTCTCWGFRRWKRCKHVAALRRLKARGLLPAFPELAW
jgi:hypothetical protein